MRVEPCVANAVFAVPEKKLTYTEALENEGVYKAEGDWRMVVIHAPYMPRQKCALFVLGTEVQVRVDPAPEMQKYTRTNEKVYLSIK